MTRFNRYALLFAALMVLAACGGGDDTEPATDTGDAATETADDTPADTPDDGATETADEPADGDMAGVTLDTASSDLGTILVDGEGMTLYVFDNDSGGESSCYDACADTWPPLTGEATASGEADAGLIGTTERTDGTTQVTYDGSPLYYYAPDSEPGDTTGQGVGDIWWVVGPDGAKITGESAAATNDGTGRSNEGY